VLFGIVQFYNERLGIGWEWQSIDSGTRPASLGGKETGKNPTDQGKSGGFTNLIELVLLVGGERVYLPGVYC